MQVTTDFSANSSILASEVNQNFADVENGFSALTTANLASDAGIESTQIADRYVIVPVHIPIIPNNGWAAGAGTAATMVALGSAGQRWILPTSFSTVLKHKLELKSGQEAWICKIELIAAEVNGSPQVKILKGSTTLGGAAVTLAASNTYYTLENSNPLDNPLAACQDGDELLFQLYDANGAGAGTARGLSAMITLKVELTN